MSKQEEVKEEYKTFVHRFAKVVTKKFVLIYTDKTDEMKDSKPSISLSGSGLHEVMSFTVDEATDLRNALDKILAEVK